MGGTWRKLHKILGLSVGALLLLVCFSGGVLVFKENLIALNLESRSHSPAYNIESLSQGLEQIIAYHALDDIYYIKTPTQGRDYWLLATRDEQLYLYDGITREPVIDHLNIQPILHWLSHFHTELLLPTSGTTLLTLIGIFTLLIMLAGFLSWWPGRQGFRWKHFWIKPSRRGPALRQHRAVAIVCLPLLLLSVVTGGGMSVQSSLRFLFPPEVNTASVTKDNSEKTNTAMEFDSRQLSAMLKQTQTALPKSELTLIGLPNAQRNQLRLRFRAPDEWHVNGKTNVIIDAIRGDMQIKGIETASTGQKILNTFYPLHSSYGLPTFYKTLVALTGILSVWLAVLGYIAWFKRKRSAAS